MTNYKDLYLYKILAAKVHKFIVKINPEAEMGRVYYKTYHRYPNLKEPKNLIEKIYWMQLHTDTSMWTKCADKYAMREYIRECGYEHHLPRNYGHWYDVNEIDFEALPNEFVLKSNNGCGTVMIVKEKSKLDIKKTKRKLKQWLKVPYGWAGGQLHYTRIKPCIIAEELLHQDEDQNRISPSSMIDYKVWCINGEPENVLLVYGRNRSGYYLDLYDVRWNRLSDKLKGNGHFFFNEEPITKPTCLNEMLTMAHELSKPFPEVRVDFYIVNEKPVIGELTFSTGYGYFTDDYYNYLGNKLIVSNLQWGGVKRFFKKLNSQWLQFLYTNHIKNDKRINGKKPEPTEQSLTDYKVWCFNGVPECILVVHNRSKKVNYILDMYDTNWNRIPNSLKHNSHNTGNEVLYPKPNCLSEMLNMASGLSQPFPEVRVDFYVINNKPIIGELTFTSGYGNYTDEFYDYLGSKLDISKIKYVK